MNSDELKHNEVPETHRNGKQPVAPEPPSSQEANRLSALASQSSDANSTPLPTGESTDKPKPFSKRALIVGTAVALLIIGGLLLGWVPRWRQSRSTADDTSQLAIPSVSVVSPEPGTNRDGLVLPAEV